MATKYAPVTSFITGSWTNVFIPVEIPYGLRKQIVRDLHQCCRQYAAHETEYPSPADNETMTQLLGKYEAFPPPAVTGKPAVNAFHSAPHCLRSLRLPLAPVRGVISRNSCLCLKYIPATSSRYYGRPF